MNGRGLAASSISYLLMDLRTHLLLQPLQEQKAAPEGVALACGRGTICIGLWGYHDRAAYLSSCNADIPTGIMKTN